MCSPRGFRLWNGLGLLLVAGALLLSPGRLAAQVRDTVVKRPDSVRVPIPPGADSLLRDSLAQRDSALARIRRDTIKAPISRAEVPIEIGIRQTLRWNRDSIYATGAITLADMLDRIPGVSTFRAGWVAAPANAAYLGDFRQVRVFFDGIEMPVLDPRSGGALDLTQVPLWGAEEIVLEQAPEEIRVHIRTWRVRLTTPVTRADVSTGDQQTNLYRGYFGKRYRGGGVFQFAAQQFGTTPPSFLGNSADQLGMMLRGGWAGRRLSVDAVLLTNGRHRGVIVADPIIQQPEDSIPTIESTRLDGYLRIGTGDPDTSRAWAQVLAVGTRYQYTGVRTFANLVPVTAAESALVNASLDTSTFRSQYIATGGVGRGPIRLSATGRFYGGERQSLFIPSARASFQTQPLSLSAFVQGKSVDSVARADVTAQLTPLSFISVIGSLGIANNRQVTDSAFTTRYARGEAGIRLHDIWFVGGMLWRDNARLAPPIVFDTLFAPVADGSTTGVTAAIRGRVWHFIHADLSAIRWMGDSLNAYRPRYQTRSELFVRTNLLDRFPSGNFGLMASVIHEYRSGVVFPINAVPTVAAPGFRTFSTLLEIRILSATISWQFRNFMGERYSQVPFFLMPRQTNYYGVRWEFFN